jgi:flagellar motor component MotA
MFIFGIVIFLLGSTLLAAWAGGEIGMFIDPVSLLLIFVSLLAVLTATRSYRIFWGGLKAMIQPENSFSGDLCKQAVSLFRLLSKTIAIASLMGGVLGGIIVLWTVESIETLGRGLAVAFTTPFYGFGLIIAVFEPIVFNLKRRM